MIKNVDKLLSDKNIDKVAKEIVQSFNDYTPLEKIVDVEERDAARETAALDFDYHVMKDGKMMSEKRNTEFKFDPEKDSCLWKIIDTFYHDDETRLPGQEDFEKLDIFVAKLEKNLEVKYIDELKSIIREKVLGGADDNFIPLKTIKIMEVELSNPAMPYSIKVLKGVPVNNEDVPKTQISSQLTQEYMDTGKSFEQIIAEKKAVGDPDYRYVFGVHLQKIWYQCHLHLWVDYSTINPEESDLGKAKKQMENNDEQ